MSNWTLYLYEAYGRCAMYPDHLRRRVVETMTQSLCIDMRRIREGR